MSEQPRDFDKETQPLKAVAAEQDVDPRDEILVAYLDGELSTAETERLESQLASEAELRERLHQLQVSWDLLDELPQSQPDRSFLQNTIEMVVSSSLKRPQPRQRAALLGVGIVAIFGVALGCAFLCVRWNQAQPFQQFLASLDFLENVEVYDELQEVAFLEELQGAEVFTPEDILAYQGVASLADDPDANGLAQSPTRFEDMPESQVIQLKQAWRAFQQNPPEGQTKLEKMHRQIVQRSDSEHLLATARTYANWLKSIPVQQKYEIAETPMSERVTKVIAVREQQERKNFGRYGNTRLPLKDVVPVLLWWTEFVEKKKDAALAKINELFPEETNPFDRLTAERRFAYLLTLDRTSTFALMGPEDFQDLEAMVSEQTSRTLAGKSLDSQRLLVERWLQAAILATRQVPDDTLWTFYDSLSSDVKNGFDGLDRAAWRQVLREKYLENQPTISDEIWNLLLNEPAAKASEKSPIGEGGNQ